VTVDTLVVVVIQKLVTVSASVPTMVDPDVIVVMKVTMDSLTVDVSRTFHSFYVKHFI